MSFTKLGQVKDSMQDSSTEEEDVGYISLSKYMELINADVMRTLDIRRDTNKLMQLLPNVQQKIKILKKLQAETTKIEAEYFAELHALVCKYHELYIPLYEKRNQIVTGTYEPTDQEAQWHLDNKDENLKNQLKNKANIDEEQSPETISKIADTIDKADLTGIPNFWLTIFQNDNFLSEIVQPQDEPILTHLQDIKVNYSDNSMSFTLAFHFSPNQYFTNSVLTKEYFMKCELDEDNPFNFEGIEIYKSKGCAINWNKDMNVTQKILEKKQRHKSRGVVRTVTKTSENISFFNFFSPPEVPENTEEEEIEYELDYFLSFDFEIGLYFKEKIVPKAILFYIGNTIEHKDGDYKEHNLVTRTEESESDCETSGIITKDANFEHQ